MHLGEVLGLLRHGGVATLVSAVAEGIALSFGLLRRGVGEAAYFIFLFAGGDRSES